MTIYTVISTDDLIREPLDHCVVGSYTSRGHALDKCVEYIVERLALRNDLAWAMAHDINHSEAKRFFSKRRTDDQIVVKRGCLEKLKRYLRDELGAAGAYYVYERYDNVWHFDIDENDVEGQLWTTVTWGDSDCEDPEFTTPFPETFVSENDAIENFYRYALDLKQQYEIEVSEGFKTFVYDSLRKDGKCQVDLSDGCCVSCVLYSTPAEGIR